jgi:hypothetical protein
MALVDPSYILRLSRVVSCHIVIVELFSLPALIMRT